MNLGLTGGAGAGLFDEQSGALLFGVLLGDAMFNLLVSILIVSNSKRDHFSNSSSVCEVPAGCAAVSSSLW